MEMCDRILINDEIQPFDTDQKAAVNAAYSKIASFGERVLGCAYDFKEQQDCYELDVSDVK